MRRRNVPCSPCGSGSSDCGCCPPKSIKKINNIEPDDNGKFEVRAGTNVTITDITNGIEISSAGSVEDVVKTVNGVSPDADGEVTITAGSNITITPDAGTNSIEISASGGTPQAVAPIYIDNDGKIALKDWHIVTYTDWSGFLDSNNCATEDLYVLIYGPTSNIYGDGYLPKGLNINVGSLDITRYDSSSPQGVRNGYIAYSNIFTATLTVNAVTYGITGDKSGSGANETITVATGSATTVLAKRTTITYNDEGIRLLVRS